MVTCTIYFNYQKKKKTAIHPLECARPSFQKLHILEYKFCNFALIFDFLIGSFSSFCIFGFINKIFCLLTMNVQKSFPAYYRFPMVLDYRDTGMNHAWNHAKYVF